MGDTTRAPTQGPRPKGRHDAALSFPFGIGTKAVNRFYVHQYTLLRISRHEFLHFTVNHQHRDRAADTKKNGMTKRKIEYWVIPPEADGEFVAHMEEVLETYEKAYDPADPGIVYGRAASSAPQGNSTADRRNRRPSPAR